MRFRSFLVTFGFAAMAVAAQGQLSSAGPLVGDWRGAGQRVADGRFINPCWDVESALGRQFNVELKLEVIGGAEPCVFEADCTLLPRNGLLGFGQDSDHYVLFSGRERADGDGSVRVAGITYVVFDRSFRPIDAGAFAVVQMFGGADWETLGGAPVGGSRRGSYLSRLDGRVGAMSADLRNLDQNERGDPSSTTGVVGEGQMDDVFLGGRSGMADVPLGIQGTVTPPERDHPSRIALIGQCVSGAPAGVVALMIGVTSPPGAGPASDITGGYRLYRSIFDLVGEILWGSDGSLDHGAFELPAVQ